MPSKSTLPEPEPEEEGALLNEEEDLSSGNGRLAIIVGALLLLAIMGYVLLPGSGGRQVVTTLIPSVMLGEASVTGTRLADDTATVAPAPAEEMVQTTATATVVPSAIAPKPVVRPEAEASLDTRTTESVALVKEPEVEAPTEAVPETPTEAPANVVLSGRILDENGQPLAGATVLVKGSHKGTGTDANGNYTLEVPAGESALVYGYGGYQDQEVRIRGAQPINVTLLPAAGTKRRRK